MASSSAVALLIKEWPPQLLETVLQDQELVCQKSTELCLCLIATRGKAVASASIFETLFRIYSLFPLCWLQ